MNWKRKCWRIFCLALPILIDQALNKAEAWTARKRDEDMPHWERW